MSSALTCRGDKAIPPILLLHGFLGDGHDFDDVIPALSQTWCPYTLELPGHGVNPISDGRPFDPGDKFWPEIERVLTGGPAVFRGLIGYSMGGRVAQVLHRRWPARFETLVLESSAPGLSLLEERKKRLAQDFELANHLAACEGNPGAFENFLRRWYSQALFAGQGDIDILVQSRLAGSPRALAGALRNLSVGHMDDMVPYLKEQFPGGKGFLFVAGERDDKYLEIGRALARETGGSLRVMPGCGHNTHRQSPGAFAKILADFLPR